MSVAVLPVFSRLWHSDAEIRNASSAQLIAHLQVVQAQESSEKSLEEDCHDDIHIDNLASDVSYSLKRLIRGLGSPRESSRLGFAVALSEVSLARLFTNFLQPC